MTKPLAALALFDKLAELYQQKYMDVSLYHDILDVFCGSVKIPNSEILELACGPGNVTKYLLEKRPDFKILATDFAPKMIELAKKNNPEAEFQVLDCREISSIEKKYDAIVCSFCLPYLKKDETEKLIADSFKILNPDGLLYLSTMEDDYENSKIVSSSTGEQTQMYFYTGAFLKSVLESNGFVVEKLHRQPFPTNDKTVVTDLIMMARGKP